LHCEYEAAKLRRDIKKTAEVKTAEPASDPEQPEVDPAGRRAGRPIGLSSKKLFSVSTQIMSSQSTISTLKLATPAGRKVAKALQKLNKAYGDFAKQDEPKSKKAARKFESQRKAEGQRRPRTQHFFEDS